MWQELAKHGVQSFATATSARKRMAEVERGLGELCTAIASVAARRDLSGIERARSLRAKPTSGGKSLYECLNQLIHYWYCCAAASYLLRLGYGDLLTRPTAEESTSDENDAFDILASHPDGVTIVGEVFCVSSGLWPIKMKKTARKLSAAPPNSLRLIFYNLEVKEAYRAKRQGLFFFGIGAPAGDVELVCSTDQRKLPGIAQPNASSGRVTPHAEAQQRSAGRP